MAVLAVLLVAFVSPGLSDGPLDSRSIAANATASLIVERSAALGIDFVRGENFEEPEKPSPDRDALKQAGPGAWLDSQIQVPDDSIAEPPPSLRDYLEARRDTVWAVVAALEKQSPAWSEPKGEGVLPFPYLLPTIRLQKILLGIALIEARDGRVIDAGRALEASWSLDRPLAERPLMIHQMVSVAAQKWQAGVLRKMAEPPLAWMGRLDGNDPWRRILDSIASDADWSDGSGTLPVSDPFTKVAREAPDAIAQGLGRLPPCEAAALEEDEVWKFAERAMVAPSSTEVAEVRRIYREISLPNTLGTIRRAARLAVDRELTLQILQLRLEKAGDPDGRWPTKLLNPASTVCPAAFYDYRADAHGMDIRFEGSIAAPTSGSVLPLSFRSHASAPRPGSPAPPPLTPTPAGGMIAPP